MMSYDDDKKLMNKKNFTNFYLVYSYLIPGSRGKKERKKERKKRKKLLHSRGESTLHIMWSDP